MTESISQTEILEAIPKRRGRKPKVDSQEPQEKKVWSDPEYRKNYYHKYYSTKRDKNYITCVCGTKCMATYIYIHEQSKHHQQYLDMKQKLMEELEAKQKLGTVSFC